MAGKQLILQDLSIPLLFAFFVIDMNLLSLVLRVVRQFSGYHLYLFVILHIIFRMG